MENMDPDETFDDCKELPFLRLDNGMVNIF